MNLYEQRLFKLGKIKELYDKRNTQDFISGKFKMSLNHVGKVLRLLDYSYTRKKNFENLNLGELINPIVRLEELQFLDKYDLSNFIKY